MRDFVKFIGHSLRLVTQGNRLYWAWIAFLLCLIGVGITGYIHQFQTGLIATNMRDPVSWGFYIGNFTFLVGVAAAAVVLVIPAYIYSWGPIKEIVVIGELLAVSAIVMCLLFVTADIGHPERFTHLFPIIGKPNFPDSLLSWDVLVLNVYLFLNLAIATHMVFRAFQHRHYSKPFALPLIFISIPAAVSIHTVTAFLYCGLVSRPYWNSALLAPRFLASAFCSGPAIILILLQLLRRFADLEIKQIAIAKIAELMAYAMFINLFFTGVEIFREYYSHTHHIIHHKYLFGLAVGHGIGLYGWSSVICSFIAFLLFLIPATRNNRYTLNLGALLIYIGVYIEKGIGLIIPGFVPSTLWGEIYEYKPSWTELKVAVGIFGIGFLVFTLLVKATIPIMVEHRRQTTASGYFPPVKAADQTSA